MLCSPAEARVLEHHLPASLADAAGVRAVAFTVQWEWGLWSTGALRARSPPLCHSIWWVGGWGCVCEIKVHPKVLEVTHPWLLPSGPASVAIVTNKGGMTNHPFTGPLLWNCWDFHQCAEPHQHIAIFGGLENEFDLFQFEISPRVILSALGPCVDNAFILNRVIFSRLSDHSLLGMCGLVTQNLMGSVRTGGLPSPRDLLFRPDRVIVGFRPQEEAVGPRGVILELQWLLAQEIHSLL